MSLNDLLVHFYITHNADSPSTICAVRVEYAQVQKDSAVESASIHYGEIVVEMSLNQLGIFM